VPGRGAKADVDLEDLLDVAERPERLDLGGTLCCPACGIRMDPFRLARFEEPPSVLVIQLMRFKPEGTMWVKSHVPVTCPPVLRFPPSRLRHEGGAQPLYELRAAVLHDGDMSAGHFRALACWHGGWWLCDDARVTPCGSEALAGASGDVYGAFYARVS
jgi:ubiquitin C-terminal hydrolase